MADLVVITPTRSRPVRFDALCEAVRFTTNSRVEVIGLVDDDDPVRAAYKGLRWGAQIGERRSLSGWTNWAARQLLDDPGSILDQAEPPRYLASFGDDHLPRTMGWDVKLIDAIEQLDGPGIAYGNDLYQGERLPTAWVVSAEVVRALGWMMLPSCEHMYVDTAVLELGRAAGRIAYRADVVIEHVHPLAGKTGWDDSYRATNAATRFAADRAAFEAWLADGLADDVQTVKATHN